MRVPGRVFASEKLLPAMMEDNALQQGRTAPSPPGTAWAIRQGYGWEGDLERMEHNGRLADAKPDEVSQRAISRGAPQVGSLGGGNHFLEIQIVDEIFDPVAAEAFGLRLGRVCVMI